MESVTYNQNVYLQLASAAQAAFVDARYADSKCLLSKLTAALPPGSSLFSRISYNEAVVRFYECGPCSSASPLLLGTMVLLPAEMRPEPSATDDEILSTLVSTQHVAAIRASAGFVPLLNLCVLAYHTNRVLEAAAVGAFLFDHVEAMEDWLALRTCYIFIDINFRLCNPGTIRRVMSYVEQLVPALSQQQASPGLDGSVRDLDSVARHVTVVPRHVGLNLSCLSLPASLSDLKFCMHMYAARLGAAHDDTKSLKKEAKSAVSCSEDDNRCPTAAALIIKAKLEPNAIKVFRIMESIRAQASPLVFTSVRPLLLNNLGIVHHKIGCHAIAAAYLDLACKTFDELFEKFPLDESKSPAKPRPFSIIACSHDTHVSYNLALQHMRLGNFRAALCLLGRCGKSDRVLSQNSPMLWIRMAESCIGESNRNTRDAPPAQIRGRGQARRFVLQSAQAGNEQLMRYAAICARAAVALMDNVSGIPSEGAGCNIGSPDMSPHGLDIRQAGNQTRCSALALLAYATLHFDPSSTVSACNELVSSSRPGDSNHAVLGHIYSAEALCLLGRPGEAAERLNPLLALSGTSIADGREGAFVNASLAHALQGDMAAAARVAKAALKVTASSPANRSPRRNAIQVATYLHLRDKDLESARQVLRLSPQLPS